MKAYKLTNEKGQTRGGLQWGENITHKATGSVEDLCSNGWIHFYQHPLIAVLMNPVHAKFTNPILWECKTAGEHKHEPLKSGCKQLTTIRQIEIPVVTTSQRTAFGILCAKCVYSEQEWNRWADNWLNNIDRSKESASVAAYYAVYAASASYASYSASYSASYYAAASASYASYSTYYYATSDAAVYAADADAKINFVALAEQCLSY